MKFYAITLLYARNDKKVIYLSTEEDLYDDEEIIDCAIREELLEDSDMSYVDSIKEIDQEEYEEYAA